MDEPFGCYSLVHPKDTIVIPSGDPQVCDTFLWPSDLLEVWGYDREGRVKVSTHDERDFCIPANLLERYVWKEQK